MRVTQLLLALASAHACDLFATPANLSAARDAVRARLAASNSILRADLTVCVSGTHLIPRDAPFTLDAADAVAPASPGRVVWRGAPGAALSGGLQVTSWAPSSLAGAPAFVASLPAAYPADLPVRALWVAGARAARTSSDGAALGVFTRWASADNATVGFTTSKPIPAAWANSTTSIEFSWAIVIANWIQPRCTLASVDLATRNITLAKPCGELVDTREVHRKVRVPAPVAIEAALAPLAPGTFWHDVEGARIFYALADGQTAADLEASAWVPAADVLLQLTNTSGHTFSGLTFEYGGWWQVNTPAGFVDQQTAVYNGGLEPPGAVRASGVSGVVFDSCVFSHIASPYAIAIGNSSSGSGVSHSTFSDLSGGAVKLGGVGANAFSADPADWDARLFVTDSVIGNSSLEYEGAAAVFAGYVQTADISHNEIADVSYSSISVGWGWGRSFPKGAGNSTVSFNRIARIMRRLRDGGGIYTNGAEDGAGGAEGWTSRITDNYVTEDEAVFAVIYLDNGSSMWDVRRNVADASPLACKSSNALYSARRATCDPYPKPPKRLTLINPNRTQGAHISRGRPTQYHLPSTPASRTCIIAAASRQRSIARTTAA
jgi:hypothetical protein